MIGVQRDMYVVEMVAYDYIVIKARDLALGLNVDTENAYQKAKRR